MSQRVILMALKAEAQKLAFDANLYEAGQTSYLYGKRASQKRRRILAEIAKLEPGSNKASVGLQEPPGEAGAGPQVGSYIQLRIEGLLDDPGGS